MAIIIIGHYMFLNLFLAILLKFIADNHKDKDPNEIDEED